MPLNCTLKMPYAIFYNIKNKEYMAARDNWHQNRENRKPGTLEAEATWAPGTVGCKPVSPSSAVCLWVSPRVSLGLFFSFEGSESSPITCLIEDWVIL